MRADYWNPVRIKFGRGALSALPELLAGREALLVTTPGSLRRGWGEKLKKLCGESLLRITDKVIPNPTIASIGECYGEVRDFDFQVVIGLGGGSALDTAKVVAYLCGQSPGEEWLSRYFRMGADKPSGGRPRPVVAIPTTAGTGSEATPWATVWDEKLKKKYSLADDRLFPEWALLDPALTGTLPYDLTLYGGLDCLSHAMEAVWNRNANPVSTEMAVRAVEMIMEVWRDNFRERYVLPATREKMQLAALLAGLAFSNTKTALAHSISYPLTALLGMPHGLACGFTLPEILRRNGEEKGGAVAPLVRAIGSSTLGAAAADLYSVFQEIGVAEHLKRFVRTASALDGIGAEYISPGRADNNIVEVTQQAAAAIAAAAVGRLTENIIP